VLCYVDGGKWCDVFVDVDVDVVVVDICNSFFGYARFRIL
jgi:hypothetical protein